MAKLIFGLLLAALAQAAPTLSDVVCDSPTPYSIRCSWISSTSASTVIKYGTVSGGAKTTVDRGTLNSKAHSVTIGGSLAASIYYAFACSDDGTGEACSSEQTITTGAASAVFEPTAPTAVDTWTAGGGTVRTVGSDCGHATTGLAALWEASSLGDEIVIPTTTLNCGGIVLTDKGAGTTGILIRTDSTNLPPAGVRLQGSSWTTSKIYRSWFDYRQMSTAEVDALSGNVALADFNPGAIVFAYSSGTTWRVKKATLAGSPVTITACSNATPIVCTTATAHGFSDGNTVCIDGVQGNLAANGCFVAASASGSTITLKQRDGTTNQAGSGAYTSGGRIQGLTWAAITPSTSNAGRLVGACSTPNAWGHDTTASPFDRGMYRCGSDGVWHQVFHTQWPGTTSAGHTNRFVVVADVAAHHVRFLGIDFADLPVDPEPEFAYGPKNGNANSENAYGQTIADLFRGERDSHHISFDRVRAESDLDKWWTQISFQGSTSHIEIKNSSISVGRYQLAYIPENERGSNVFAFQDSKGPILISNNSITAAGWCFFSYEGQTWVQHGDVTFERNNCVGVLSRSAYGTSYYTKVVPATGPTRFVTRQPLEAKTGSRMRFRGNIIDGWPTSATPVTYAAFFGTRWGEVFGLDVASNGVVTTPNYYPAHSLAVDQKVVLHNTDFGSGTPGIFRVAATSPLTLKMLNGDAYSAGARSYIRMCALDVAHQIQDIEFSSNTILRVPSGVQLTGESVYSAECDWGPSARILVRNNVAKLEPVGQIGGWYGITTTNVVTNFAWVDGLTDFVRFSHNTSQAVDPSVSDYVVGFYSDSNATKWKNTGLKILDNVLVAEDLGVQGTSGTGSTLLDLRWPAGSLFSTNGLLRAGGTISGLPSGNVFPTTSAMAWANTATLDYRMKAAGSHRGQTSSDGLPLGHSVQQLNIDQGRVSDIRATAGSGTLTVRWKYDGGAACTVDASQNNFATYTRQAAGVSTRQQSATLTLAAGSWDYRVLCPGTVDPVVISTKTVY